MRKFATLFYWQRQHCWFGAICFCRRCCSYNDDNDCRSNNNDDGSTDYNYDDNRCSYNDDNDCRSNNNDDGSTDDYDNYNCSADYDDDDNVATDDYDNYNCSADYDYDDNVATDDYDNDDNDCRFNNNNNNYRPKKCLQRLDHFCIADFGNTGCQILFGGVGDMSKQNE